ncbi:TraR/DksA C4-type zinc finger protein [Photorhabdus sp. RM71S]
MPSATHCHCCGEPISEQRRRALPSVKLCLDCKWLKEH